MAFGFTAFTLSQVKNALTKLTTSLLLGFLKPYFSLLKNVVTQSFKCNMAL